MTYQLRYQEITGDQDEDTYQLHVAKEAVPDATPGVALVGEVVTIRGGRQLLIISPGEPAPGELEIPVWETEGDPGTDDVLLMLDKISVPPHVGQDLTATRLDLGAGEWLLVAPLPAEEPPTP